MDGSTVCLSALVTVINGAKNIHVQGLCVDTRRHFSQVLRTKIAGSHVNVCVTLGFTRRTRMLIWKTEVCFSLVLGLHPWSWLPASGREASCGIKPLAIITEAFIL